MKLTVFFSGIPDIQPKVSRCGILGALPLDVLNQSVMLVCRYSFDDQRFLA